MKPELFLSFFFVIIGFAFISMPAFFTNRPVHTHDLINLGLGICFFIMSSSFITIYKLKK